MEIDSFIKEIEGNEALVKDLSDLEFEKIDLSKLVKNTQIETEFLIDTVESKGLFSRLNDAIKGRVPVQKEMIVHKIIFEYDEGQYQGTMDEQLNKLINQINAKYKKQLILHKS